MKIKDSNIHLISIMTIEKDHRPSIFVVLDGHYERNATDAAAGSKYVIGASILLIAVVAVFSNTLIIVLWMTHRKLKTSFFCPVINLALADLMVGLFSVTLHSAGKDDVLLLGILL